MLGKVLKAMPSALLTAGLGLGESCHLWWGDSLTQPLGGLRPTRTHTSWGLSPLSASPTGCWAPLWGCARAGDLVSMSP